MRAEASKVRVLVVDDDVDGATAFAVLLQALDCATEVAYDGPTALGAAVTFAPHLAFIDLEMPGMSGRDVVRHLRANQPNSGTRLICLTGTILPEAERLCLRDGFDAFIAKPMAPEALAAVIADARSRLEAKAVDERSEGVALLLGRMPPT